MGIQELMRARIKEGWYPYEVGFIVEVEPYDSHSSLYKILRICSGIRKNYKLCKKKLTGTIISNQYLDFNYNNMKDTVKTFRVKIKDNHPNPSMKGILAHVTLDTRLDIGDRYRVESVDLKAGNACFNEPYYIMDEYLDFEPSDEVDLNATNEYEAKSIKNAKKENVRKYDSGAQRDGDENKPYVHNLQGYTRLRFGYLTRTGAKKYGDGNFLKGFPNDSLIESMDRHWAQYLDGDRSEDHLAALIFGVNSLMLNEKKEGIKADHWFKREEK